MTMNSRSLIEQSLQLGHSAVRIHSPHQIFGC